MSRPRLRALSVRQNLEAVMKRGREYSRYVVAIQRARGKYVPASQGANLLAGLREDEGERAETEGTLDGVEVE